MQHRPITCDLKANHTLSTLKSNDVAFPHVSCGLTIFKIYSCDWLLSTSIKEVPVFVGRHLVTLFYH